MMPASEGYISRVRLIASLSRLPVTLLSLACTFSSPAPRSADEPLAVELAAAQHMLVRRASGGITLDSLFARSVDAPGQPNAGRRSSARTLALARDLSARISSDRAQPGVYLLLSEPVVRGNAAEITITAVWSSGERGGGGPAGYETRALVLTREHGVWRVVRHVQLGIS